MHSRDTTLGGAEQRFPQTTGDFVSGIASGNGAIDSATLEELCRRYWKPIYSYIRIAWAKSNEDAKDLTQAFFLWIFETPDLSRFDRSQGSFRTYLKTLLRSFVGHQEQALHALKRGGAVRIISLEGVAPELRELASDPQTTDPDRIYHQVWKVEVIQGCLARVRDRCESSGRALAYRVYSEYALSDQGSRPTYADLARRHGISERDVETHLTAVRREVREEMRAEIARQAGNPQAAHEEWNELFGT